MDFVSQSRYLGDAGSEYVKTLDNLLEVLNNASTYMSVEHRSHDFRPQPEGQGSRGVPGRQAEQSQGGGSKSPESQPLPNVWDVLEREARIYEERSSDRISHTVYNCEFREVNRLKDEIEEKGTACDNLILDLHLAITKEPTGALPVPLRFRKLSLEEFQQFRSKVEPMSDEEIREEIRKAEGEFERKGKANPGPSFSTGNAASV